MSKSEYSTVKLMLELVRDSSYSVKLYTVNRVSASARKSSFIFRTVEQIARLVYLSCKGACLVAPLKEFGNACIDSPCIAVVFKGDDLVVSRLVDVVFSPSSSNLALISVDVDSHPFNSSTMALSEVPSTVLLQVHILPYLPSSL